MALYNLVKLRHSLVNAVSIEAAQTCLSNLRNQINSITDQVEHIGTADQEYINQLVDEYDQIMARVTATEQSVTNKLHEIDQTIKEITHKLFANNYELEELYGSVEQVREVRRISVHDDVKQIILQRILLHTGWKYPALEIGCRDGEWTEHLVAADPLYVIDRQQEFLDSTASKFNARYQERLRRYLFKDTNLDFLPQEQFGFIFSWGYFNFVSVDTMTQLLKEIMKLLRPGGVFLFSYNDGDTVSGAGMAENFARSYMPKSILIPLCQSLGFKILKEFDFDDISWIEIQRAGELSTVKAHQVMGKILPIVS